MEVISQDVMMSAVRFFRGCFFFSVRSTRIMEIKYIVTWISIHLFVVLKPGTAVHIAVKPLVQSVGIKSHIII